MKEIHFPTPPSSVLIRLDTASVKARISLEVGQVLDGEVIEVIDDQHALLSLKGFVLTVESQVPLQKGMEGRFEVTSVHPHILLKLLEGEGEQLQEIERRRAALFLALSSSGELSERLSRVWVSAREKAPPSIQETMDRLLRGWMAMAPIQSGVLGPNEIERWVLMSGLFFEPLLRRWVREGGSNRMEEEVGQEVKGLLLKLKGQLIEEKRGGGRSPSGSREIEELLDGVDHLLKKIETHQQFSISSSSQPGGKVFLLLPFWWDGQLQLVDLLLSLPNPESEGPEGRARTIQILLHLPEWGRVSLEMKMIGKRLLGQWCFSLEEVADFFREGIPKLQERFLGLGFQPEIRVTTRRPEKIIEHFMEELGGDEGPLVNLVV